MSGLNLLEWFQKECLCAVYFEEDTLFAEPRGTPYCTMAISACGLEYCRRQGAERKGCSDKCPSNPDAQITHRRGETYQSRQKEAGKGGIKRDKRVRTGLPTHFPERGKRKNRKRTRRLHGIQRHYHRFLMPFFGKGDVCKS